MSIAVGIVRPDRFILAADKKIIGGGGYYRNEILTKVFQPHGDFAVAMVGTCSQINVAQDLLCGGPTSGAEIASGIREWGFPRFFMQHFRGRLHEAICAGPREDEKTHDIQMLWACAYEPALYCVDIALGYTLCYTYTAIGSGSYHALGVMYAWEQFDAGRAFAYQPEQCAKSAVQAAGEFSPDCGSDSDVITVERKVGE